MRTLHEPNTPQPEPSALVRNAGQVPGAHERGSALLIVIGTLALISVFAAIYVSIGRTDRRAATAVRTQNDQLESSKFIADYLSGIVGDDRLDAYVQIDGSMQAIGRREMTDAPYTDWTKRSAITGTDRYNLFTPTGGPLSMTGLVAGTDTSVQSDPWLSSTTPVYLGNPGIQGADRPFSQYEGYDSNYPNAKNFLDNRDWLQISNFAKDGRFVNLFSLRPNEAFGDGTIGSFFAEPGLGTVTDADGRSVRRMSENLSLWDQANPGDPESLIQTHVPSANGNSIWVPGQNAPITIPGLTDLENIPAVWTMYQRFMFMPINQPFITLNRNGAESTWADPDFPAYQYADASGSGFADSRWFELSSARDFNEDNNTSERDDVEVLYNNKNYRYFVAARAVDLSSMVNVNTATDLLVPPTSEYPLGLTPADIDLRRILTTQDAASDYTGHRNFRPLAYSFLHRPFGPDSRDADGSWVRPRGAIAYGRDPQDYRLYEHDFEGGSDLRALDYRTPSILAGRYAYSALRRGIIEGGSLSRRYVGSDTGTGSTFEQLRQYEQSPGNANTQITSEERYNQYQDFGRLNPTNRALAWARRSGAGSGNLYGLEDLTELLTFRMLNDPEHQSRLERVMGGRYESAPEGGVDDALQGSRLSPLLSNRPLELDREQHGLAVEDLFTMNPITRPGRDGEVRRGNNGRISFNSMAHNALSVRNYITTLSGSVALHSGRKLVDAADPSALSFENSSPYIKDAIGNPSLLFDIYSDALAGELDADNDPTIWDMNIPSLGANPRSTLFYGHRGPELALRIAAHASVNMKDMTDADSNPTVATVILDGSGNGGNVRNFFTDSFGNPATGIQPTDSLYQLYPGAASGNLFDLDPNMTPPADNRLAAGTLVDERQVVNVYGFEAMPVITEVSVMYAYTDSERGDSDFNALIGPNFGGIGDSVVYPPRAAIEHATIDGTLDTSNEDYLGQVLAIQLHNPYDQDISLGGNNARAGQAGAPLTRQLADGDPTSIDQASNFQFDYYIEFAGRFYKLANYLEHYPVRGGINTVLGDNLVALDNPTTTEAFGTVPNPVTGIPIAGAQLEPGTHTSAAAASNVIGGAWSYTNLAPYSDFMSRDVLLAAGRTRTFYVIPENRFDNPAGALFDGPDKRWLDELISVGNSALTVNYEPGGNDLDADLLADGTDSQGWTGPAEEWVNAQLRTFVSDSDSSLPVHLMEFDPRDGQNLNERLLSSSIDDPTITTSAPIFSARSSSNTEVRLWKKVVALGEESNDSSVPAGERTLRNYIENDLLVDRLTLNEVLTVPLPASNNDITGSVSFDPATPTIDNAGDPVRNDNTGISLATWKSVRRGDYPVAAQSDTRPESGQITPWMLRSRSNPTLNQALYEHDFPTDLDVSHFFTIVGGGIDITLPETEVAIKGEYEFSDSYARFQGETVLNNRFHILQSLILAPHWKYNVEGQTDDAGSGNRTLTKFPPLPITVTGTALGHLVDLALGVNIQAPEILMSGHNIEETPRLADLLLAWGIGPTFAPDPLRAPGSAEYVASEWMTGPEALAIALGIEQSTSSTATDADHIWDEAYDHTTAANKSLLDDGRLVIDDFVPYLNNTAEAPSEFTTATDVLRGTGVPTALGVMDQVRAIEGLSQINEPDPSDTGLTDRDNLLIALSRPTFGSVNINTAPIEVLRALPGLTPSRGAYVGGATADEWWGKDPAIVTDGELNLPNLTLVDPLPTVPSSTENPDVAAAIVAYRDRQFGVPNTAARNSDYDSQIPLTFEPTDPTLFASNMRGEVQVATTPPAALPGFGAPLDRASVTGINGLRSMPGFGSLGELLAVRINPEFEISDGFRWDNQRQLSIQQYGFDDKYSGMYRTGGNNITIMSQLFRYRSRTSPGRPGDNMDDYAERLAMANSVLNTISVRSDFYAVWFLVHGYQESDVANLRPEDPLIPSVAKRYLMIVDRTNVIEPGDKPKILVLKEVPL